MPRSDRVVEADDAERAVTARIGSAGDDAGVEFAQRLHRGSPARRPWKASAVELEERAVLGGDTSRMIAGSARQRLATGVGVAVEQRLLGGVAVEAGDVLDPSVVVEQRHHRPSRRRAERAAAPAACAASLGVHRRAELVGHRRQELPAGPGRRSTRSRFWALSIADAMREAMSSIRTRSGAGRCVAVESRPAR